MILFRKTILTITVLTALLQLTCTPVFAEDTGRTTRTAVEHRTRERVLIRVRVRREVPDRNTYRSDTSGTASEKTASMNREMASSDSRDNSRDSLSDRSQMNQDRNFDHGGEKNSSSGHDGHTQLVSSERSQPLATILGDEANHKQRRLVKRLVRVNLRAFSRNQPVTDGYAKGANIDINNLVASINPSSVKQGGQLAPMNDLDKPTPYGHEVRGDINRGDVFSKGTAKNGALSNDATATLNNTITDLQNNPTGRPDGHSTKAHNNCATRPNKNCVTMPTDNGLARLPSQPRYQTDQDEALAAVENGTIMPWKEALKQLSHNVSGKVIGVRMSQTSEGSVYQVKVRTPEGEIKRVLVDAKTGQILQILGY